VDIVSEVSAGGRRLRIFTVVDSYTRECLALEVDTLLPSRRVTRALAEIMDRRGAPVAIRSDSGPEVSSRHFLAWCIEKRIRCGAHSAGQTHAERAHRKLQRQTSRRVSERELVLEPVRRTGEDRGLAGGLQLAAATLGAQVLNARRVRAEGRFAFFNFECHTSGSASRLP